MLIVTVVEEELATPAADEADLPIGRLTLSPGRFDGRRSGARVVELPTRLPLLRMLVGQSSPPEFRGRLRRWAVIP